MSINSVKILCHSFKITMYSEVNTWFLLSHAEKYIFLILKSDLILPYS